MLFLHFENRSQALTRFFDNITTNLYIHVYVI